MIHERGYWLSEKETNVHVFDEPLAETICSLYPVKTAVDIGCGNGKYTKYFNEQKIKCVGYDGSPLTPDITGGLCAVKDFSVLQNIGNFDLVVSLEVGEHIPRKYEPIFINNICRASHKYIVLSWAVEGQPGVGHVNCRNNDYVILKMSDQGFRLNRVNTMWLRECSTLPWFANTILAFEKR
jgi:hypothetical protein